MVIVNVAEQGIAIQIRKKLGRPYQYGKRIYGKIKYGEQETITGPGQYGKRIYGIEKYSEVIIPYGIYRVRHERHKYFVANDKERGIQYTQKETFYIPSNPQTPNQQANRQKLTNAVEAWQALTNTQKQVYNTRAKYKPYTGNNLYIKEYILSH